MKRTNIHLDEPTRVWLKDNADRTGVKSAEQVRRFIYDGIQRVEKQRQPRPEPLARDDAV